jgi:DNA-binding CsgD family transcriptional regulator
MARSAPLDAVGEARTGDGLRAALATVARTSGMPIAFGGRVEPGARGPGGVPAVTIRELIGTRTTNLRDLAVRSGAGLGGRVLAEARPAGVEDYGLARGITHDYDAPVLAEGLCTVAAAPVLVGGRPRAVLYAASRERGAIGDRVRNALVRAAADLAAELTVREDVDRALATAATAQRRDVRDVAQLEEVRAVHAELRLIAQDLPDDGLRARIRDACSRLAALSSAGAATPHVRLTPRETDVLALVALGCSNADTAGRLALQPETVKSYLGSAMTKLDAHTRHEAVVLARRSGLLP